MEAESDEGLGFLDVAKYVVSYLSTKELATLAAVCTETASLMRQQHVWRSACEREFKVVTDEIAPKSFSRWRDLCKTLQKALLGTPVTTVLAFAASASSVDRPEESPARTLAPSLCYSSDDIATKYNCQCSFRPCYWSSEACPTPDKDEWIVYGCVSPCVITHLEVAAYEAFWQQHGDVVPIYWPRKVALSVSEGPDGGKDGFRQLGEWPIPQGAGREAQRFELPAPVLVTTGFLRLELIGKMQRQTIPFADDYYVCLNFVHVGGTPLWNFAAKPAGDGKLLLMAPWDDPCAVCGEPADDDVSCCARGRFCCREHTAQGRSSHRPFHIREIFQPPQ